ncbi:MAG: COX15/CtaA family protein [Actinobacteria bacterium]|nr:COX15/CtaA family protein [Actinomycetota bacterium]
MTLWETFSTYKRRAWRTFLVLQVKLKASFSVYERRAWRTFLVFQVGLMLTGGAVRLTKSGLGCPEWPDCVQGSIGPQPSQIEGIHSWIEFGNRLLTILLVLNLSYVFLASRVNGRLRKLAMMQLGGLIAQIVLGGITVWTKLNPLAVAGHYLLSTILIAGIVRALHQLNKERTAINVKREIFLLSRVLVGLTAIVLIVGTFVTGSGPHAGDDKAPRYPFDAARLAVFHADLVIALVVGTISLWLLLRVTKRPVPRAYFYFVGAIMLQGLIGYLQYFTGLPEVLVAIHLLGSGLVWSAANFLFYSFEKEILTND